MPTKETNDSARAFGVMDARLPFPAERGGSIPTKALHFCEITSQHAQKLVRQWHRTHPIIGAVNTMKVCYGASFNGVLYAAAMWSNPVARMLPQNTWLELRRLAIANDAPKNTATRMLAWMERDIRRRWSGIECLLSYQNCEEHDGTIYRAKGDWSPVDVRISGGPWSNRQRKRTAVRLDFKIRWEKRLVCLTGEAKE
jgi:hypothetical protein